MVTGGGQFRMDGFYKILVNRIFFENNSFTENFYRIFFLKKGLRKFRFIKKIYKIVFYKKILQKTDYSLTLD